MKAIHTMLVNTASLRPAARTNGTANGTGVDLANASGCEVIFTTGVITDGTHTPKLQDSADNSTFADVVAADQVGTLAALTTNTDQEVSYIGSKRYIRAVITTSGATTGGVLGAYVVASGPRKQPA